MMPKEKHVIVSKWKVLMLLGAYTILYGLISWSSILGKSKIDVKEINVKTESSIINDNKTKKNMANDNDYFSIRGKIVFPIGLFTNLGVDKKSSASLLVKSKEAYSDELITKLLLKIAEGGFDFIQSYSVPYYAEGIGTESRVSAQSKLLEFASKADLKVLLNLGYLADPKAMGMGSKNNLHNLDNELKSIIDVVKENPNLIGYYIADEPFPAGIPVELLETIYAIIKIYDAKNPVLLVDIDKRAINKYYNAADIISTDIYPIVQRRIGLDEYFRRLDSFRNEVKKADNKKVFWNVVQLSAINEHNGPSIQELHAMTFASIIAGCRGIMYFSFDFPDGPLPIFRPDLWDSAISVVNRIKSLEKIILSKRYYMRINTDSTNVKILGKFTEESDNCYLNLIAARFPPIGQEENEETVTFNLGMIDTQDNEISVSELNPGQAKPVKKVIIKERTKNGAIMFKDRYDGISTKVYRLKANNN
jgi:hypothetical protein